MEIKDKDLVVRDIARLEKEIFSDSWSEDMLNDTFKYDYNHVITMDQELSPGSVSGYVIFSEIAGEAELLRIAVSEECRGKGIASSLMEKMLLALKEKGAQRVILEVRSENAPAIGLYKKFGFCEIAKRKGYYTDPSDDAVVMERCEAKVS